MRWRVYEHKTQPEIECEIVEAEDCYINNSGALGFSGSDENPLTLDRLIIKAFRTWYKVEIIKENEEHNDGEPV